MQNTPCYSVRLVHIDGPRKGEIDKTSKDVLLVGRHPQSDILFPASERIISRKHAQIIRTGNHFRLLNHSQNGCFINGKSAHSANLHNGDVIMFSRNGPKVSFLFSEIHCSKLDASKATASIAKYARLKEPLINSAEKMTSVQPTPFQNRKWHSISFDETQNGNFTIQFGPRIFSHSKHMIKLGRHINNDIVIEHHCVQDQHAEIRYQLNNFFLRGVYQNNKVFLNGRTVTDYVRLIKQDIIMFGPNGPQICYLGEGRFIEVSNKIAKPGAQAELPIIPLQAKRFHQNPFFEKNT